MDFAYLTSVPRSTLTTEPIDKIFTHLCSFCVTCISSTRTFVDINFTVISFKAGHASTLISKP